MADVAINSLGRKMIQMNKMDSAVIWDDQGIHVVCPELSEGDLLTKGYVFALITRYLFSNRDRFTGVIQQILSMMEQDGLIEKKK